MKGEAKKLLELFGTLAPAQQETLMAFAEFLVAREERGIAAAPAQPLPIERPAQETVVMAIRRLVCTYPMLDRRRLMADTSRFVAEHALEGRAAQEVIDELEAVFARHYKQMCNDE
ncbi:MAG: hypothetical protein A3G24_19255 [Betaproteobacteria bacterium RIFCSPLOWO2_12_FULL_62_13]|nr:MAG: hypothetical protein A3G24_19255 [Betaproteobacteria bacterium RIFCSPLOWO2_12_FULL_62_13]